jgi:hypothetical protein
VKREDFMLKSVVVNDMLHVLPLIGSFGIEALAGKSAQKPAEASTPECATSF